MASTVFCRMTEDLISGKLLYFASAKNKTKIDVSNFVDQIVVKQRIRRGQFFENKISNLKTAAHKIQNFPIFPGEIFSFYRFIGNPNTKGYKIGRTLIRGKLSESIGGGLCQLAGLMYHLAIESGFEILERHNHSVDMYSEKERYSPLGLDAAVTYWKKDLRFRNNFQFPICFSFEISSFEIIGKVKSIEKITRYSPEIISIEKFGVKEVQLSRVIENKPESKELLGTFFYVSKNEHSNE